MNIQKLEEMLSGGKSLNEISKEMGYSLTNLCYWCKKCNLKSQYSPFSKNGKIKKSIRNTLRYENLDWNKIQKYYDEGHTYKDVCKEFKISTASLSKYIKLGFLKMRTSQETISKFPKPRPKTSEKTKKLQSDKRKEYLKNNPEKHPWKNPNKKTSKPCNQVKAFFRQYNIDFIEEYSPNIKDRFFSIDIALVDKQIAIEINGQQHYDNNGNLKKYYQERHDLLEKAGWKVFEIHYSLCFNVEFWQNFIEKWCRRQGSNLR